MAPKQKIKVESRMGSGVRVLRVKGKMAKGPRGNRGQVTRAQARAQAEVTFFQDRIPLVVRDETEAIEKHLWEEVQTIPIENI